MKRFLATFAAGLALTVAMTPVAALAQADIAAAKSVVVAAKAQGVVGEQGDGFLGFVSGGADPSVKSAVATINAGRADAYRQIAARSGVSEAAAAQAAAAQVIGGLARGAYYRPIDGAWTRK